MCTVTFIPVKDKIFITSNRDEKYARKQAIPPEIYFDNGTRFMYPKDADAGGTWIAMNEKGHAAVLLNGGFENHVSNPPYKKSRGVIFLEIIHDIMPLNYFMQMNLDQIEPFTLIIFDDGLYECRWTGTAKHCKQLERQSPYIWSSSTLYDETVVKKREIWFAAFLNNNSDPSLEDILNFHQFTGDGDKHNDLMMNRSGLIYTVSITGITLENGYGKLRYLDLKNSSIHNSEMKFTPVLKTESIYNNQHTC